MGKAVGRRRDEDVTLRVRRAAAEAFAHKGFGSVTMGDVAAAAGVGLDSIYRRWSSKQAVLVDVVAEMVSEDVTVPDTGSFAGDLTALLSGLIRSVNGEMGRLLAAAVGEAATDSDLAHQLAEAQDRRRAATIEVAERAVARGELASSSDANLILDLAAGYVWQQCLIARRHIGPEAAAAVVDALLRGFSM